MHADDHIHDRDEQLPLMAAEKLRRLLEDQDSIIVCPGIYDGFTARLALRAGFQCLYMVCLSYHISSPHPCIEVML